MGVAVTLQTMDSLFPMLILSVRTIAEQTFSISIISGVIGNLRII
jgi:hypothetical protein